MTARLRTSSVVLVLSILAIANAAARDLTIEERIAAQKAIESTYYRYQTGATGPFEDAVPGEVIERKVQRYLHQSAALERRWNTPITAEMLRREMERITRSSRLPHRLLEIYAALGDDPVLIQECFIRPILVDRLARSYFASDERIHGQARSRLASLRRRLLEGSIDARDEHRLRRLTVDPGASEHPGSRVAEGDGRIGPIIETEDRYRFEVVLDEWGGRRDIAVYESAKIDWDSWWGDHRAEFDAGSIVPIASNEGGLAMPALGSIDCDPDDTWDTDTILDESPVARTNHTAVWTGIEMIVWGGTSTNVGNNTGARYDPMIDSWRSLTTVGAPSSRRFHTAVWTGNEMIIWGGGTQVPLETTRTGGRYDPIRDSWTPTRTGGAPAARWQHTAVWTGTEMIVWGGAAQSSYLKSGGVYDPANDSWSSTKISGAPSGRLDHTAVWTGTWMAIWGGGEGALEVNTGALYDPAANAWQSMSTVGAPSVRRYHAAAWSDDRLIIWGGSDDLGPLATGGRYDPDSDIWTSMSTNLEPAAREDHTMVATSNDVIIWGGFDGIAYRADGKRYDPGSDTWTVLTSLNAPSGRRLHTAILAGDSMLIWGGETASRETATATGGRLDVVGGTWAPTSIGPGPELRTEHTAIWTGTEMIVWGGFSDRVLDTGGRYDPMTDSWTPTSLTLAPSARDRHVAVWTGNEMVLWGGYDGGPGGVTRSGGRYNPLTGTWRSTSLSGSPTPRADPTAVWTGNRMLIWGGGLGLSDTNTGGQYNPVADSWTSITTVNAPAARQLQAGVWTGTHMVIWGGRGDGAVLDSGGRYDPGTNSWLPLTTVGAPEGRPFPTAVWTGSEALYWGGLFGGTYFGTGGRYDPIADSWTPISVIDAPAARGHHSAIWTGREMVIWGGWGGERFTIGGRYHPATDSWLPTSSINAPEGRQRHTAVWTGSYMVVWGGGPPGPGHGGRLALNHADDLDGDGFSNCEGDCNDADPTFSPAAAEICDGLDNDCDGLVDNWPVSCGVGECVTSGSCVDGVPVCTPGTPTPEQCDNLDNDCDGVIDDFATGSCGVGECMATGFCSLGVISCFPGTPSPEVCDNLDNDCDGVIDGFVAGSCGLGECARDAICSAGMIECTPGTPGTAICNGLDNDCDGQIDQGPGEDFDGDGVGDFCDLDDGIIVVQLRGTSLYWDPEDTFTSFNLYRSDLIVLQQTGVYTQDPLAVPLAAHACDSPIPSGDSGPDPPSGRALVYFVTGENLTQEGDLGRDSTGALRPNDNPCP